jgi:hypothetical protein
MGLLDTLINAVGGAAAASHSHDTGNEGRMGSTEAAGWFAKQSAHGAHAEASWWAGYAGEAARRGK